ncbi:transglutaminase [Chryseobacterium sp. ERMR1:04]|nr:transglutaminase [Chryseobacterium sp. ERMR1:04]
MKKIILLLCNLIIFNAMTAQKHEFLKIPKFNEADLSKPKSLIDENAPAEFLHRSSDFVIDAKTGELHKKFFARIKIYSKEKAEKWLSLEIPLMEVGNKHEYVTLKAITYNIENGKVISTKVSKDSKYKSIEDKNITITKFAFPNVKDGSIIEYQYEIESPFLLSIPEVFIETEIPSVYTEYVLDTPQSILFSMNYSGSINPKYTLSQDDSFYNIPYKTYRFGFENVKGFKTEKFVGNDNNYKTKIKAELNSINFLGRFEQYNLTWDQIMKNLYENSHFGGELGKAKIAKENMPIEVLSAKSLQEKADIIFNFVKNQYTWNKERGIFTSNGIKKLIESKTGNAAEINLLLIAMLREIGIKADPLLISTVNNGIINMAFPSTYNVDFIIAAVETKDGYHLYDATSRQSSCNELPPRDWNQFGILLSKDKAKQLDMINLKPSFKYLTIEAKINENGSISGSYSDKDKGTFAILSKESYDDNADKYKRQYKENFSTNFLEINSKILENGEFESTMKFLEDNLIDKVGKKIIINPMLFLSKNSNEFDQVEQRKYRIDFISPLVKVKKVVLEIPEGYSIEELPKSKKIVTEDKEISYNYVVEQKGNTLEIISTTTVNSADYPKEYYPAFKQIWGVASKTENQVISLIKK